MNNLLHKPVSTSNGNVCTRCGKLRITISSYEEMVGNSNITYTVTACSDPKCQKVVDDNLLKEDQKRAIFKDEQQKREQLRKQSSFRSSQKI